jgi:hypothetical protein
MGLKRFAVAFLIAAGLAGGARAEVFHMKDGSRFDGTIVGVTPDDLQVDVAGRTLTIRKDSIGWIDYEPSWDGKTMRQGEQILKVGFGAAVPLPAYGFAGIASPGLSSSVEYMINVRSHWGLGVRTDGFNFASGNTSGPTATGTGYVNAAAIYLEGRWLAFPEKRLSPFVVAGAGLNEYSEELQITPKPGVTWADTGTAETRAVYGNSLGSAFIVGAGAQYLLSRRWLADVEASWHYWTIDQNTFANFLQNSAAVQSLSLVARIGLRF